jgi:L-fucose isomerase-like protein
MNQASFDSGACGCCRSRRRFLATACRLCAAAAVPAALTPLAAPIRAAPSDGRPVPDRPRVRLVFACFALKQNRPTWPHIGYDFIPETERVTAALQARCPQVEFLPTIAHGPEDAQKLLAAGDAERIDGYVVYQMNNWVQVMQTIVASGKPTIVADFLFAGSGGFLTYTAALRRAHRNFSVVASSAMADLAAATECFAVVKQGGSAADFAAACDRVRQQRTRPETSAAGKADPLSVAPMAQCLEATKRAKLVTVGGAMQNVAKDIRQVLGIEVIPVEFKELAEASERANREQVQTVARRWQRAARRVALQDAQTTLEHSARNFLGQQAVMNKYQAEAITINCLGGFYGGQLRAYPCLGYVELLDGGLVGACEADLLSTATMVTMKHLIGRPGFISDPVLDTSKRQIIYAHCVAATRVFGPAAPANPFEILTHSEDRRGASVRSFLPLGYMTSTMEIHPGRKEVLFHRAKAKANVVLDRACRTKLAGEVVGDMERLFMHWDQYGWHRVTFYGDLREPVRELATALRLTFVEEA